MRWQKTKRQPEGQRFTLLLAPPIIGSPSAAKAIRSKPRMETKAADRWRPFYGAFAELVLCLIFFLLQRFEPAYRQAGPLETSSKLETVTTHKQRRFLFLRPIVEEDGFSLLLVRPFADHD